MDQDASFLISTMRANPGNTKIAMLSLKMSERIPSRANRPHSNQPRVRMEEAESGFLEADDLESNLRSAFGFGFEM